LTITRHQPGRDAPFTASREQLDACEACVGGGQPSTRACTKALHGRSARNVCAMFHPVHALSPSGPDRRTSLIDTSASVDSAVVDELPIGWSDASEDRRLAHAP